MSNNVEKPRYIVIKNWGMYEVIDRKIGYIHAAYAKAEDAYDMARTLNAT